MELKKWFIKFEENEFSQLGFGVTALSIEDSLEILKSNVFKSNELPKILECEEITSLNQLEQNHVMPNISDHLARGIWFPQGF